MQLIDPASNRLRFFERSRATDLDVGKPRARRLKPGTYTLTLVSTGKSGRTVFERRMVTLVV